MKRRGIRVLGSRKRLLVAATIALVALGAIGGGVYAAFGGAGQSQSLSSSPINLDSGLVAHWPLNGSLKDSTPYANNASAVSAVPTTDRKGEANSAYAFTGSGTTTYLTAPYSPSLYPSTTVSASAWVKFNSFFNVATVCATNRVLNGGNDNTTGYGIDVGSVAGCGVFTGNEYAVFRVKFTDTTTLSVAGTTNLSLNTWYHIAGTFDGSYVRVYLNGVLEGTSTLVTGKTLNNPGLPILVGWNNAGSYSYNVDGSIDDIRIYNRAINASEATALYNSYDTTTKLDSGASGLVDQYKMNGNAKDSAPLANNGTPSGATLTADREGKANSAYSFNGSSAIFATANGLPATGAPITISAWTNVTGASGAITRMFDSGAVSNEVRFGISANRSHISINGNDTLGPTITAGWHLLTATYDGTTAKIYSDGILQISNPVTATPHIPNSFYIGTAGGSDNYTGLLDDLRIYNRAISATEVGNIYSTYDGGLTVSNLQSGLIADYPFNGNAKDGTPNANNGTVTGATLTTDRKGRPNSAYNFNGSTDYITNGTSGLLDPHQAHTGVAWFYHTTTATQAVMGIANSVGAVIILNVSDTGVSVVGNGGLVKLNLAVSISTNQWHQVAYSYGGSAVGQPGTFCAYLDGQSLGCNVVGVDGNAGAINQYVIANSLGGPVKFAGKIDDARLYNRALSVTEVSDLYNSYR